MTAEPSDPPAPDDWDSDDWDEPARTDDDVW
jgi:hypothetical protein